MKIGQFSQRQFFVSLFLLAIFCLMLSKLFTDTWLSNIFQNLGTELFGGMALAAAFYWYEARINLRKSTITKLSESNNHSERMKQLDVLRQNGWLSDGSLAQQSFKRLDLSGLDFSGANLRTCDFTEATLNNVNFLGADLTGAIFYVADLQNVNLSEAKLKNVDFRFANLADANLSNTYLDGVDFTEANLQNAKTSKTIYTDSTKLPDKSMGTQGNSLRRFRDSMSPNAKFWRSDDEYSPAHPKTLFYSIRNNRYTD